VSTAKSLSRNVPKLTDAQVGMGLSHLAALLGDAHSYLVPNLAMVPVQFYQFNDGLYVVKASGAAADLVGSRVDRIGNVSSDSALKVIAATVPKDNEMTPLFLGVIILSMPQALNARGLSSDSSHITLTVTPPGGAARTVTLAPEQWAPERQLGAPPGVNTPLPLWLQHPDNAHWFVPMPDVHAIYAQYNTVGDSPTETVAQFASRLDSALASPSVTSLIVDVRHNNGGNRTLNTPLLLAMAKFKRSAPNHRVFIIMGRGTFSAAQVFISQAEWMVDPIYVGEPSSSKPNFVGEESGTVLPYSGMRGSVSSQYHQGTTYQDERPFIAPQIPVTLSSRDYFSNRDPAMEAIISLLR
jgi:hypothetical protein